MGLSFMQKPHVIYDADILFKLYYSSGSAYLNIAQRAKARNALEASLEILEKASDELKLSPQPHLAKLHLGVTYRYMPKFSPASSQLKLHYSKYQQEALDSP